MKNKDKRPYNENGERHGYWERYHDNGKLWYKGTYVNGIKHGYWELYYSDGNLDYKGSYVNSEQHGYWEEPWLNSFNYYI